MNLDIQESILFWTALIISLGSGISFIVLVFISKKLTKTFKLIGAGFSIILTIFITWLSNDISKKRSANEECMKHRDDSIAYATNRSADTTYKLAEKLSSAIEIVDHTINHLDTTTFRVEVNLRKQNEMINQQSYLLSRQNEIITNQNKTIAHLGNEAHFPFFPVEIRVCYYIPEAKCFSDFEFLRSHMNDSFYLDPDSLKLYDIEYVFNKLFYEPKIAVDVRGEKRPAFQLASYLHDMANALISDCDLSIISDTNETNAALLYMASTHNKVSLIAVDFVSKMLRIEVLMERDLYYMAGGYFNSLMNIKNGYIQIEERANERSRSFMGAIRLICGHNRYVYEILLSDEFLLYPNDYGKNYKIPVSRIIKD